MRFKCTNLPGHMVGLLGIFHLTLSHLLQTLIEQAFRSIYGQYTVMMTFSC
jgi:hypothetical protein